MNVGWLIAVIVVAAAATAVWRRRRFLSSPGGQPRVSARKAGMVKRVEAYSFPLLGLVLVIGALAFWELWVSLAGLAIGALFLVTGAISLRDLRGRQADN